MLKPQSRRARPSWAQGSEVAFCSPAEGAGWPRPRKYASAESPQNSTVSAWPPRLENQTTQA